MDIDDLKSQLSRFNIRPNKLLGQNFLLSEEVLDEIVAAAELKSSDTVLEIGPGLGALTARLAEAAGQVIAIEKDRGLARALRKMFKGNVKIVEGDALFLNTYNLQLTTYKLIANIPYYITGKLLQKFLTGGNLKVSVTQSGDVAEAFRPPSLMVLLLQKEVAERIVAKPGDMSILSVSVQFYADPEIISYVGRENFYPVPEVDSAIVRITPLSSPLNLRGERGELRFAVDEKKFFQLVKIGFSNKRKQLQNNLQALNNPNLRMYPNAPNIRGIRMRLVDSDYKLLLQSIGQNPLCRAEDLSLEDWYRLYKKFLS